MVEDRPDNDKRTRKAQGILCFFVALFVQIIKARKLPTAPGLLEVINNHFVSRRVRAGDSELLWILRVHLRLCFTEASGRVRLFVEDLSITFNELGLGPDAGYTVRHRNGKLGKTRDTFHVMFTDGASESLPERFERIRSLSPAAR